MLIEARDKRFPRMFESDLHPLFLNTKGQPLTPNALSQLLIRASLGYFEKTTNMYLNTQSPLSEPAKSVRLSTTMIRKILASDLSADKNEKQKELASKMKHSVDTQNKIYVKKPQEKVAGTKDD